MKKIKNNIKEDYVTFEVAKLLAKHGFNCECRSHYEHSLTEQIDEQDGASGPFGWKKGELNIISDYNVNSLLNRYENTAWESYSRPTTTLVLKWLRVNFNAIIMVEGFKKTWRYYINIPKLNGSTIDFSKTQEEAENEGILYFLKSLK